MYQFNNLTSNVPNVQTFNAAASITYQSQGTTSYAYQGVNVSGVPSANGQLFQRTTTIIAYFKIDGTGLAAPIPQVSGQFTYGTGANGWVNAIITAVTDSTTYWIITVGTAFAGTLTTSTTYTLETKMAISPWQPWTKPNDALLIHILCIGGGAGGGSGRRDGGGSQRLGGGGGGGAAVTSMFVPAFLIPDTLYIQVGLGGTGGAGATVNPGNGNAGAAGGTSYVALYPSYNGTSQVGNLLLSANGGSGGSGGFGSGAGGAGGAGGTTTGVGAASPFYLGLGQFTSTASQAGSSASATSSPTNLIISGITGGGSAGGTLDQFGTSFAGGAIVSPSALIPYLTSLAGGVSNGVLVVNGASNNGYAVKKPLMFIGGTGSGGATGFRISLKGGDGATGCGGGGAGANFSTSTTPGAGGNGGNGIVIITSYSI
jgi:hypothetical protein